MLIAKTDMQLSGMHELKSTTVQQLKLAAMPRADDSFAKLLDTQMQAPPAQLLTVETGAPPGSFKRERGPFEAIMEMLFGLPRLPDDAAGELPGSGKPRGGGLQVMQLLHTRETESCTFAASGNVCLADGSTRQFEVGYRMDRSEESTEIGIASFRDPLMLDFAEPGSGLGPHSVDFDLDADGIVERMRMPGSDTAVLFLDRNKNGRPDDGTELFGPQSGDGFADLAKLDSDGNGWVDGGDEAYADLKLWQLTADSQARVRSLAEAGVGALATQNAATPFTIKENGVAIGQVRASSVWLGEAGGAGLVRQVDVAATPKATKSA